MAEITEIKRDSKGRFVKGQSGFEFKGNPSGRRKISPEAKQAIESTKEDFVLKASSYLLMTLDQLKKESQREDIPSLDLAICKLLLKTLEDGDPKNFSMLMDRVCGKPAETIKYDDDNEDSKLDDIMDKLEEIQ